MSRLTQRAHLGSLKQATLPILRGFSTAGANLQSVPPDSPLYIRLPVPPQTQERKQERVRGFLPVPREIISSNDSEHKLSRKYLDKTAPRPRSPRRGSAEREWKSSVAASRRKGLKEGLSELWERQSHVDEVRSARNAAKHEEARLRATAPERRDDRLTRGTTLKSLLDTKVYPDPERFSRADRSRDKVLAAQNAKRETRRDALMELYISASNFITTEKELREEIDNIFRDDYFAIRSEASGRWRETNAWGTEGVPPSVSSMLDASSSRSRRAMDNMTDHDRSARRQKRIAEDFTGGKM